MSLDDFNYYNDVRTQASMQDKWYTSFNQKTMTAIVFLYDDTGDEEEEVEVPVVFEVCGLCEGKGSHVNPSIDSGGICCEDFEDDPDFREDYMSGSYDVPCHECNGRRVVPVVSPGADPEIAKRIKAKIADDIDYARERAMEMAMGY